MDTVHWFVFYLLCVQIAIGNNLEIYNRVRKSETNNVKICLHRFCVPRGSSSGVFLPKQREAIIMRKINTMVITSNKIETMLIHIGQKD